MDIWGALSPASLGVVKSSCQDSDRLRIAYKILRAHMGGYPHVDVYIYKAEEAEALREKGFTVHMLMQYFYAISWNNGGRPV